MHSEDELFEALTIHWTLCDPVRPHYYYKGELREDFWGFAEGPQDRMCKNSAGQFHRIYGPAYISKKYDIEAWFKDGKRHCVSGPAYRHKNNKLWFVDGKLHRLDGPAVMIKGHPKEYWINGTHMPPKEYAKEISRRKTKGLLK